MRENYDFSDALRHPLAGKFKGKYTVTIHYDFTGRYDEVETGKDDTEAKKPAADFMHESPPSLPTEEAQGRRCPRSLRYSPAAWR